MTQKNQHPKWQAEKQPAWWVEAIRKTIASLPGGYAEAATWLSGDREDEKVTVDALFNRLRTNSNQVFPMGWAMVLQQASGTTCIADAVSRHSGSVNVRLPDFDHIDNADINLRLMESIEYIGRHSELVRKAIADGEIDSEERRALDDNSYQMLTKFHEHLALLYGVFCPTDSDAPVSRIPAKWSMR